jgi:protein arginine N-methyltransferase 1
MTASHPKNELGQFIPLVYHYNMLNDAARMTAFKEAIALTVKPGCRVLELGGGTAVLSYFAAQCGATVLCVERNPELVREARHILALNPGGERVTVFEADAFDYLPDEPVDVVICEMLHVGMLKEKQIPVIDSFKRRYLEKFGAGLPHFIPEAYFQAVQPVQQDFDFHGYHAPAPGFQDPEAIQPRTLELGKPVVYQSGSYEEALALDCSWRGEIAFERSGQFNALRFITKNVLAVVETEQRTVDWFNQYLLVPIEPPLTVAAGDRAEVDFSYQAGDPIAALKPEVKLRR